VGEFERRECSTLVDQITREGSSVRFLSTISTESIGLFCCGAWAAVERGVRRHPVQTPDDRSPRRAGARES